MGLSADRRFCLILTTFTTREDTLISESISHVVIVVPKETHGLIFLMSRFVLRLQIILELTSKPSLAGGKNLPGVNLARTVDFF